MKIERTNFEGDWNEMCPHCGEIQGSHRSIVGEYKGVRYEHRLPCEEERKKMTEDRAKLVKMANNLVAGIYTAEYVMGKIKGLIPFKDEVGLLRKLCSIKVKSKPKE